MYSCADADIPSSLLVENVVDNYLSISAAGEDKDDGCVPRVHGTPAADIELVVRILRAGKSFAFV